MIAPPETTKRLRGERDRCEIGSENRPALGCPHYLFASPVGPIRRTSTGLAQRYRIPSRAPLRKAALFTRSYRPKGLREWRPLPPLFVPELAAENDVAFPIPESVAGGEFEVSADAYALPPEAQTLGTEPLLIAPGSLLEGGLGVDPLSIEAKTPPVRFELVARTARGDRALLDETIDPATERARRWLDYRIDLSELAGEEVRFVLKTRLADEPGSAEAAIALPLWGAARILVRQKEERLPNVVLISIDTLRADHVGAYGSDLATTPNLDQLAGEGVLFENVIAPYPSTTASHMSMLTGTYPEVHDVLAPTDRLSDGITTLAEVLSAHGYQTAAVTEDGMIAWQIGIARGFGFYREFKEMSPAGSDGNVREGVSAALEWLDRHPGERFFLFLHTYQVHDPYAPPAEFQVFAPRAEAPEMTKVERDRLLYAGDVLYTDHEIGRFLGGLTERGLRDQTVVVVTADHGEAFGEHGAVGHGLYLIDPVLRVPLILRQPGALPEGLRVAAAVSLVDVTPTILALAGIAAPDDVQGLSLLPLISDPRAPRYRDRAIYSQRHHKTSATIVVHRGDHKWVFPPEHPPSVFDLATDPGENRALDDASLLAEGERFLEDYRTSNGVALHQLKGSSPAGPTELDEPTREKLRRLGYAE